MNDPLQDERISAYLDGEMTVEERAEFEQQLAADPERRRLLEELRALSTTLGGLPKEMLGDPFSDQVLRKAERAVLTQSTAQETHEKPHEKAQIGSIYEKPVLPIGYSRRGWVWASLAVATALVLMIALQEQDPLGPKLAKRQPVLGKAAIESADELAAAVDVEIRAKTEAEIGRDELDRVKAIHEHVAEEGLTRRPSGRLRESAVAESSIAGPQPTSQVMVVHVDMRADAADQSKLNQVLVSNGIACDVKAQYGVPAYRLADRDRSDVREELSSRAGGFRKKLGAAPEAVRGGGLGGGGNENAGNGDARKGANEDVVYEDVVYVEASYSQIAQTLQQLHDNARDFPAVEVDPAPGVPAQWALVDNSRGRASNRWAMASDDHSAAPGQVAKLGQAAKSEAAPLGVQLQGVFADRPSAKVSGKDLAQAARVPARQREVAERIVIGNRAYNLKNKNVGSGTENQSDRAALNSNFKRQLAEDLAFKEKSEASDDESWQPQQEPSDARSWYRSDDRVYVLFVLNVVEALGGETSNTPAAQEGQE